MSKNGNDLKVLVVEDSKVIMTALCNYLGRMGIIPLTAVTGQEAIEIFRNDRPDIILLDVILPDIDGFDIARQLRDMEKGDEWAAIIFLTVMGKDEDLARGIKVGGDDYLIKPITEVVLHAKLRAMCRLVEKHRSLINDAAVEHRETTRGKYMNETVKEAALLPVRSNGGLGVFDLQRELYGWAHDIEILDANHLAKLGDELKELVDAPGDALEMADVLLALMLHAEQNGVDLLRVGRQKLEIIKGRTYGKPDERGVVRHIDTTNLELLRTSTMDGLAGISKD